MISQLRFRIVQYFGVHRKTKIMALLVLGYSMAFFGYEWFILHAKLPHQTQVLLYEEDLSAGMGVARSQLRSAWIDVEGSFSDLLSPEDRQRATQLPLLRAVKKGEPARHSDFLFSSETWSEPLPSDLGSVWIPHVPIRHHFSAGSRLDLFGPGGRPLASDVILLENKEDAFLIAIPKSKMPSLLQAMNAGGVFSTYRHQGKSRKESYKRSRKVIQSQVSW